MTSFLQYCVNTLGYLRLMTVSDLIDIAILSFLFYKCIGIFQRTNAAKVAKALLLIIVAMWISYQFNLNAISFILNKAVELGLLALVVIFPAGNSPVFGAHGSNNVSRISRFSGMKPQSAMWRRPFRRRWRPMERCRKTGWAP